MACKSHYTASSHIDQQYVVKDSIPSDSVSALARYLQPFRDSLSQQMSEVIGSAQDNFLKEKPGGSLGNLVADAMDWKAQQLDSTVAGAICNYGGVRLNQISKGIINKGKIYELMPFENELVIVQLKGSVLIQWLNAIAVAGGWPLRMQSPVIQSVNRSASDTVQHKHSTQSSQIDLVLSNVKSSNTANCRLYFLHNELIPSSCDTIYREQPDGNIAMDISCYNIDKEKMYRIATNDYVANGGDHCDFLKNQRSVHTGVLIRDLLMDYIRQQKIVKPDPQHRILLQQD